MRALMLAALLTLGSCASAPALAGAASVPRRRILRGSPHPACRAKPPRARRWAAS